MSEQRNLDAKVIDGTWSGVSGNEQCDAAGIYLV